jgi:hypothetical protein
MSSFFICELKSAVNWSACEREGRGGWLPLEKRYMVTINGLLSPAPIQVASGIDARFVTQI